MISPNTYVHCPISLVVILGRALSAKSKVLVREEVASARVGSSTEGESNNNTWIS
jgi:hypothetical protein